MAHLSPEEIAESALRHHQLLLAYCDKAALLPMRFGTVFSTPAALQAAVSTQRETYQHALSTLALLQSFVFQIEVTGEAAVSPEQTVSGRDFLTTKRKARDLRQSLHLQRRAFVERIESEIAPLGGRPPTQGRRSSTRILDLTLLIPTTLVPKLERVAAKRGEEAQELGLACKISGPWPAYTFDLDNMPTPEVCNVA